MSWPSDGKPRYVIVECEGYATSLTGSALPGLSVIVADRGYAHRTAHEFKTEHHRYRSREWARRKVREQAAKLCARLNAE